MIDTPVIERLTLQQAADIRSSSTPGSEPLFDKAARLHAAGRLVPVEQLLTPAGWSAAITDLSYTEAGSFVRYLVDAYGLDRMKQVFQSIVYSDPTDVIKTKFQAIYGKSLEAAEAEWHGYLEQGG